MKDQELYLKGMNDLHEAMKWYRSQGNTVIAKIFDGHCYAVAYTLDVYKPQDFVNRIENYKKEQAKPKLGMWWRLSLLIMNVLEPYTSKNWEVVKLLFLLTDVVNIRHVL